jgi:hypothetical protein
MKRYVPFLGFAAGLIALLFLLPVFRPGQPKGSSITRPQAQAIADVMAREIGIPVERTWPALTWMSSQIIGKELRHDPRREQAWDDPVLGPRLNAYRINYYHNGGDKFPPAGYVIVGARTGQVTGARLRLKAEDAGVNATEAQLRASSDAFVKSRVFRGAPHPEFESARPTVLRGRTDWIFRYKVQPQLDVQGVVPYLYVYFAGDRFVGWELAEEYADGRVYLGESGGDVANSLAGFATLFIMMLILLVIFLRKYHAGEVGVEAATFVFGTFIVLSLISSLLMRPAAADGIAMGALDARTTSWAFVAFKLLFIDVPLAVSLFLAWAVGESYARERWSDKLSAFDAILRRDPLNATVGRSLIRGLLFAPVVAASAFAVALIPVLLGKSWIGPGTGTLEVLYIGGPLQLLLHALVEAPIVSIGVLLFVLAWTSRRRMLPVGIVVALFLGVVAGCCEAPIEPVFWRLIFGFGGIAAAIAIFLGYDLLTASTAVFGGTLLTLALPLLTVAEGPLHTDLVTALALPLVGLVGFGIAAMLTRREVVYQHEDLAPHVKRIAERERVKAEIDAANRIQAALLPLDTPNLAGASVSSHYRAATEIGGDYFDFLPQPNGDIGIAFGDVSGHGLTSGIVMAMAKAALMVQVDYDASPRAVLNVLNDIVIRTAPKRILMTFFFGLLDPRAQTLKFATAGHHDPYVYRADKGQVEALSSWGFPLGVRRRDPYREHDVEFSAGDRLILYSDGLIEAVDDDGEPFGFERFEQTIIAHGHGSAEEIKKAMLTAVRKFTHNRPPEDDQTLVVVAFEEAAAELVTNEPRLAVEPAAQTIN